MGIEKAGIKISDYIAAYGKKLIETKPYTPKSKLNYVSRPSDNGMAFISSMTKAEAKEMLNGCRIRSFTAKDKVVPMKINGQEVVGRWIEGGGTKSAYRVNLNNEEVCVLLPNSGWSAALNEPQNTIIIKKLGLLTNDYCKIIPIEVEGVRFPALVSKPYDKHAFKIFDKKNPNVALDKYFDISKMKEDNIEEVFEPIMRDIKTLLDNDIRLAFDSFNIALKDGKLRLYINDLPYENVVKKGNKDNYFELYTDYATDAVAAAFSWDAMKKNPLINSLGTLEGHDKIFPRLLDLYKKMC